MRSSNRTTRPTTQEKPQPQKQKAINYLELSNEEFLRRNLYLLGVTEQIFQKETKCSLETEFFPKHQTNPTNSKIFFFISYFCLEKLTTSEEINPVHMWYPPRTVNEQLEYKKSLYKAIQNLELVGKLPKNVLLSKGTIMGDTSISSVVEFLRFLSEMSLRHQYIEKYSKREKLIQIACNNQTSLENNINRFYIHPFVPNSINSFDHPSINLDLLTQVFSDHLKIYFRKLLKLRTKSISPVLAEMHQEMMKNYIEQKQIEEKIQEKIPKNLISENRAFDRRRLIDKNTEIWNELNKIQCNFLEEKEIPVIKIEGEIDKILEKWEPVKGIANIMEANSMMKCLGEKKTVLHDNIIKFRELCDKISNQVKV